MAFQAPLTVEAMLRGIHEKKYLLPAIQREFVWGSDQIRALVDSLLRGYPIGSFLVWEVEPETASSYTFYDFLTNYHERDDPYASKATVPSGSGTLAVLDGQQRLTALNIAFYGSYAVKKKYAWWNSPDAFPTRRLYLNLLRDAESDDLGLQYDLQFLSSEEALPEPGEPDGWYPVSNVLGLADTGPSALEVLQKRGVDLNQGLSAHKRLHSLHQAVRELRPVNYFLESSQDSDKVLDIFVRVNSGGTTLSYSDLLLSMATNQWEGLDAREEVRRLVHELNTDGARVFSFTKDNVLKTALMVAGVDLRFRVSNFTTENMRKVEQSWPETKKALIRAATLLASFGFNARTLTAHSAVEPIAYYLAHRELGDNYLTSGATAADRRVIQTWVTRSLVKRGIWGSGLDTLLARLRGAINERGSDGFPLVEIEREMARAGKSLSVDATEVDELLELKYGGQRTFPVLALLYPGLDLSQQFHEDHIFPKARFTRRRELSSAGLDPDDAGRYRDLADRLPNLQLLGGLQNVEKQTKLPGDWLDDRFQGEAAQRAEYVDRNDLQGLPGTLSGFEEFYELRKERLREKLHAVLGVESQPIR